MDLIFIDATVKMFCLGSMDRDVNFNTAAGVIRSPPNAGFYLRRYSVTTVSYTHLTLPTKRIV